MTNPTRFLLAGNGGQYNRGCQAIELGTMEIVSSVAPSSEFVSASFGDRWDGDVPAPRETRVYPERDWGDFRGPGLFARKVTAVLTPLQRWRVYEGRTRYLDEYLARAAAMLCLGGDNYTFDYGRPDAFVALDKHAMERNVPVVIWGASIGPFTRSPAYERFMARHLRGLAGVFVREDDSAAYLHSIGVSENVHRVADPAFVMKPEPVMDGVLGFAILEGAVGVNVSPLLARYLGLSREQWVVRAGQIIARVRDVTGRPIVLVPHVVFPPANDDHAFMRDALASAGLADEQGQSDVHLVPPTLNAPRLKWVISRLACFVGARTHATIAAFSAGTPCASIGYSTKSFGINRDVYGHADWVVGLDALSPDSVADRVAGLLTDEAAVRDTLARRIGHVEEMARSAGPKLAGLLDA
jgi:polysaccharide pyruvyl transferase WcaK-like protein